MNIVKTINIPYGTPEWHEFRLSGIGGSEVSVLFGFQDKYGSPAKLYNQKIGRLEIPQIDNEAMFWGRELEHEILDKWQYYNGRVNYIDNFSLKQVQREYKKWDGYIVNPEYPHLFASIDGYFENGFSLITGETIEKGLIECKTITSQVSSHWKFGIPPGYVFQVHHYMLILGLDYAEIVILRDGRYLEVLPVERSESIINQIKDVTYDFWHNKVIPGRKAYQDYLLSEKLNRTELMGKHMLEVDKLEPMGDGSEGHKDFENERWKETSNRQPGDKKNYNRLVLDKKFLELGKILEREREKNVQMIRRDLRLSNSDYFEWDEGYARIYKRKNKSGESVIFDNRLKYYPNEDDLTSAFKKLITNII